VWRPVAAALAWLERIQEALPTNIPQDDFIVVVHLGPDCLEFVPFRLRERQFQGKRYVVPLREPPKMRVALSGCDWVAGLIESTFGPNGPGAFWQAFTGFPEIWEALAQRSWNPAELPRVWSRGDFWDLWDPPGSVHERMWTLDVRVSGLLSALTRESCRFPRQLSFDGSWVQLIQTHIKQVAQTYSGRLRGMILSGPLASLFPEPWLTDITPFLKARGLQDTFSAAAVPGGIWVPGFAQDPVAEGAAIYGARLLSGETTYRDTLPQLWTYAQDRGKLNWVALLDAEEVEGGKTFQHRLERRFRLQSNSKNLQVFLRRGDRQIKNASFQFPYAPRELMPLDIQIEMSPASGLAQVELVPMRKDFLRGQRVFLDYDTMGDVREEDLPKPKLGSPPLTKILNDPEDRKILSDDFKAVCERFKTTYISRDLGPYCRVVKALRDAIRQPTRFLSSSKEWTSGRIVDQDGKAATPEGQELIKQILAKLGSDLSDLLNQPLVGTSAHRRDTIKYIRQAATWLFAGAPPEVISHLKAVLQAREKTPERDVIEAAGRSFVDKEALQCLYKAIIERVRSPGERSAFPIHSARALCRILELRESGSHAIMMRTDAETFVVQALIDMEHYVEAKKFPPKFFQAAKLFLYLLRYREIDQTFLLYNNEQDHQLLDRATHCLEIAKNYVIDNPIEFQNALHLRKIRAKRPSDLATAKRIAERAADLLDAIRKYIVFEGSPDIIEVLNEFAEQDTEDSP
jgi:hypothetical protein